MRNWQVWQASLASWLDAHADPDWRLVHHMHSVQIALFWALVSGLWVALPAFQSYVSPLWFAALACGMSVLIMVGRLTKQKGFPDV